MPPKFSLSRRDFLKLSASTALLAGLPSLGTAASDDTIQISILHTTDLHGHILPTTNYQGVPDLGGFARCLTQIRQWQAANPNHVLIDVGDLYQGTDVSFRNRGKLMLDLLALGGYDAWVIGNHEFDWGIEPFHNVVAHSRTVPLANNLLVGGKRTSELQDPANVYSKIRPYLLKEVGGIKIAIVGITTPGMEYWFHPTFLEGLTFVNPVETTRLAIAEARAEGANAIILAGHMGIRKNGDDFANRTITLCANFPEVDVFIAGHTHQDVPRESVREVLFTQANYHGINCGRVDLTFDRVTKKLVAREVATVVMDASMALDATVLSMSKDELEASEETMRQTVGTLADELSVITKPTFPSDVEKLIGAAVFTAFKDRQLPIDAVFHGLFQDAAPVAPGEITIADIWKIVPYENFLVSAELTREELLTVMNETVQTRSPRSLLGLKLEGNTEGRAFIYTEVRMPDGKPLPAGRRIRVALNTFDAQSGGQRMMNLRRIIKQPEARQQLLPIQTREAIIEFFGKQKTVRITDVQRIIG